MMETTNNFPQVQICKTPVIPFKVSVLCSCGGEYIFDDAPLALHPRTFKHKCNRCGYELQLLESFPKTIYEELKSEPESD